ncbi:ABC transporter substrate-binding protein [Mitsuokella jalaludinii]|uniref:ABC transporter substrate-binding protein n=1 Tax=Mitsuokella jalaludinii TaxID=187979 RepID=UPI003F99683A
MRRYTSLLLTAFVLFLLVLAGSAYLAGADHSGGHRSRHELTVITTLPAEHAEILSQAYEESSGVHVNFVPLSADSALKRMQDMASSSDNGRASLLLADRQTLEQAAAKGYLVPYISERNDMVPNSFRQQDGYWTGVWYDPIVFCVNRDYLKTLRDDIPDSWQALARQDARIGVTDFMAADASAELFYAMTAQFGEVATMEIWRQLHPKVVQYARYLSNPVRQAGMGEVDISVAVESETLRYIHDGYPLQIIYPSDGTAARLTGIGLLAHEKKQDIAMAEAFADWLLSDEAQIALQSHNYFFIPTNPSTLAYKSFAGKNLVLFTVPVTFTDAQKRHLLDEWARNIRFK